VNTDKNPLFRICQHILGLSHMLERICPKRFPVTLSCYMSRNNISAYKASDILKKTLSVTFFISSNSLKSDFLNPTFLILGTRTQYHLSIFYSCHIKPIARPVDFQNFNFSFSIPFFFKTKVFRKVPATIAIIYYGLWSNCRNIFFKHRIPV